MKRVRARVLAAALASWAWACAGVPRIELAELPDAPLAILYRSPEEGRRRAELLRKMRGEEERRADAAIVDVDDMRRLLGRAGDELASGRLALLDPRRGDVTVLDSAPRGARPLAWSQDRDKLLFAAPRDGVPQLYLLHRASAEVRPMTRGPHAHPQGCLLPDGKLVAVQQRRSAVPSAHLVLLGRGGRPLRSLTAGPWDVQPACSPDGRHVVFVRLVGRATTNVLRIDPAGDASPRTLARGAAPAFAPDGAWIVYSAQTSRGTRLWRVRPDGSGRRTLGPGVTEEADPTVSPDGRFVAYVIEEGGREALRVKRSDGSDDRPLFDDGDAAAPVW